MSTATSARDPSELKHQRPALREVQLSVRQREILQLAIEIIAAEGYAKLTLRSLARKSGMKLGALQYHFRTWEDMLRALAAHIDREYGQAFEALESSNEGSSVEEIARFVLDDPPGSSLQTDRLFPQLWAMARVEPVMADLLDGIYAAYLRQLESALARAGHSTPAADALALMSLLEGTTLFVGDGCRWAGDAGAVREAVLALVRSHYANDEKSTS